MYVQRTRDPAPALFYHRFSAYYSEIQTVLTSVQYKCRFVVKGKKKHCQLSGPEVCIKAEAFCHLFS